MIREPTMKNRRLRQSGMTLIEVLVTLVIVSVGLLGIAALQLTTLKGNQEAYVRSQASILASYIIDRMRANQAGFAAGNYEAAMGGTGTAGTTAATDLTRWQAEIDRLLPGGAAVSGGSVARLGTTSVVTVTLQWSERMDRALQETAPVTATFTTRTEI